ncbi:MAG: XRE family transcriptional regulator [Rhizobiales bacterium TMED143]|nr:XRE family transcriptional regulator [Rhodobiaceae bacterium]OUV93106.1 MAG: XRE family transcriptional regulator [Rhizobiales bacterium TMED143]CAI8391016.1 MAG: HTH-type transcriptional regulator RamB [Rhodobiaceae bacterium UBA7378]HCQ82838.1 XRE family transcriptional regulator [Rhodobiaceae bacterium]|tara:strand:- start:666 stop:2120 length:1455 start_codon:yes stop_codon:yes gene_type:complete
MSDTSPANTPLVERKLFAGPRIRRLRRELGLTQAAMASALGISTSYLNLLERDQRPVSAQILLRLVDVFDIDPRGLAGDEEARAQAQLHEVFADPMFRDTPLSAAELKDLAAASPVGVDAVARLYQAYQESRTTTSMLAERLAGDPSAENPEALLALEEVRDFINQQGNHFSALDAAAEALYADAVADHDEPYMALRERLQANHQISTRIAPVDVMENTLRRFDRHRQTIFLSELLDQPGRSFQLAYQLAYVEHMPTIEEIIMASGLEKDNARTVARISLANYFAAAVLMPYGLFLKTAEKNHYDITLLGRRFGTSFEQVCHRLTTLQRPNARGIPFFLIRVDNAGNISKRFSAAGFHFARFGGTCPRWHVHDAFRIPGKISTQIVQMEDATRYFSIARTVSRDNSGFGVPDNQFAIGLGCEISHAQRLVYSRGINLEIEVSDTPIGINCRLCERDDCNQRATPSVNRNLRLDEHVRGLSPFGF